MSETDVDIEQRKQQMFEEMTIERELVEEAVLDLSSEQRIHIGTDRFEVEEADDSDGPVMIQRERDGARFEIEYEVHVRRLAPAAAGAATGEEETA